MPSRGARRSFCSWQTKCWCRLWPFLPSTWAGSNPGASAIDENMEVCARRRRFESLRARLPLPPVAKTDGIEFCSMSRASGAQLPRHAKHVRALLEGASQDLVSRPELVATLPGWCRRICVSARIWVYSLRAALQTSFWRDRPISRAVTGR